MKKNNELLHDFLHSGVKNWRVAIAWRKTAGLKKSMNAGKYKSPLCSGLQSWGAGSRTPISSSRDC